MSFKDRKDGKYVKQKDAMHKIMPYVLPSRHESEVYIHETIDITELKKFLEEKRKTQKMSYFNLICFATAKLIYNRPLLNRFVQGKRYYDRNNVTLSFVAKDELKENAEEKLIVVEMKPDLKLDDFTKNIREKVSSTRNSGNDMNNILNTVTKLPRPLLSLLFFICKRLDYHGILPKFLSDGDSNFTTCLLSNLGSIKCNGVYHHLNDYGTNSIVLVIGTAKKGIIVDESGKEHIRDIIDIAVTLDERIADGFYFAKSIQLLKHLLLNPELLNEEVSSKIEINE